MPVSVAFHHKPDETDALTPPMLLVASGDGARAFKHEFSGYITAGFNGHGAGVSLMTVDDQETWLMSAGADGTVMIDPLGNMDLQAVLIQVDETVVGLIHEPYTSELDVDLADGQRIHFLWRALITRPLQATSTTVARPGVDQEPCLKIVGSAETKPFTHPSGLILTLLDPHRIAVTNGTGKTFDSPRLDGDVRLVCADPAGKYITVTTAGFRTLVWSSDFARRLGPVIDESTMMDPFATAMNTDWVQLSADARTALTRSSDGFGRAPYVTAWNIATGLPLMNRQLLVETTTGGQVSATLDADGNLFGVDRNGTPTRVIELRPPPALRGVVPDYLEALGGRRLGTNGAIEPVLGRIEAIANGNKALGIDPPS
ncbi:MAG: hypothetical protein ABIQ30_11775 [Devosia sp.]